MPTLSKFDASNVFNWSDANVYIAPLTAATPAAGAELPAEWLYVGALDGGDGFETDRGSDQKKIKGWGTGTLLITDSNYEESISFTTMEVNKVTRALAHPGSTFTEGAGGDYTADIRVPRLEKFKICVEVANADKVKRKVCANYAMLEGWPKEKQSEDGVETMQFKVAIIADNTKKLWIESVAANPAA